MHRFAVSLLALSLAATPALAQDPGRMQQVIAADADKGEFMGAVLVARDGQVLLDRGYGSANLEWKIPNDGDTKFRLGSITKQFTAAAILLLQERGKLSLDAPIKTYLPDAPAAWDKVTVRHLLSHTSGIPSFTSFDDYSKSRPLPATLDSLTARFRDKPLDFQPGEKFAYSNSGYILLTTIVEKASGQPYAAFVTDNIFKPLGMADSGYDSHAAVLPRRASGYTPSPRGVINTDYIDMTIPQGAGALYSTTHDLLKWNAGLFGGKLLKPESLKAMTTPVKDKYALGLFVANVDGATMINHGGGIEGFNTWLGYDPDRKLTVVVLGNLNSGAPDRLGKSLMTLARGGNVVLPAERRAITVPAAKLREYEGTYELSPTFAVTMKVEGGKLTTQATGQDAFELFAEKPDQFFLKVADAQVSFTRDAGGKVTGLVLHQHGRDMPAKRK
ncbi:MAG: serine hydrolase [Sphingomonas sp.]|uniref:serine hydrolase n=1 Tax=Sphingomonas sp. TaxID=28214 RepID=UPI0022728D7C|nr:serine hydrolase [Sphingomonas sp.]MCX8476479.1 serine hydrolase [Sphingomonas sp.]